MIAYGSYALTKEQRRYCTTRKELLAVVRFTRQYRYYLLGRPFLIRTDHSSLTWLVSFKEPQGQLARWMEELSQYNMIMKHRPGKIHSNADALSRRPQAESCAMHPPSIGVEGIPCGGCKFCKRAEEKWGTFTRDVDEAVPLVFHADVAGNQKELSSSQVSRNQQGGKASKASVARQVRSSKYPQHNEAQESVKSNGKDKKQYSEDIYLEVLSSGDGKVIRVCGLSVGDHSKMSCWGFPKGNVQQEQSKDPDLAQILDWLRNTTHPNEADLFRASPCAKAYWLNKERFHLIEDILYHQRDETDEMDLVIPSSLKDDVLHAHHDLPSAGHQGIARTKARVKERFYWYRIGRDVAMYVSACPVCNKNKKSSRHGKVPMQEYQASEPMERVHINFLGPLPKTAHGNEYVLVMVDQFTKWVECVPLPSQTAAVTAKAAVDNFFSRFGCPFQIFSDQGRNFESKLFASLCEVLEIHKTRTTPYRPSANGQVERFNRTLMEAVRCYIKDAQDRWDDHLQQIAGAIRSAVNRNTGFTPNKLMLGREINIPAHLMFPLAAVEPVNVNEYVGTLMRNIEKAHTAARNNLKTSTKRMKRDYDIRILSRNYQEGDVIYLMDTAAITGKCKKLSSPWKGPAVVVNKLSESLFRVKLKNALLVVNHDRMKPCRDRNLPVWVHNWRSTNDQTIITAQDTNLYCICKQPWQGRFMIQCDGCDKWYHGSCVNVTASEALNIQKFWCVTCKK